jgi:hypothetical protein
LQPSISQFRYLSPPALWLGRDIVSKLSRPYWIPSQESNPEEWYWISERMHQRWFTKLQCISPGAEFINRASIGLGKLRSIEGHTKTIESYVVKLQGENPFITSFQKLRRTAQLPRSMKLFNICMHKADSIFSSKAHRFGSSFAKRTSLHCRVYAAYDTTQTESIWESGVIWNLCHGSSRKPTILWKVSQNRANLLSYVNSMSALRNWTKSRDYCKKW